MGVINNPSLTKWECKLDEVTWTECTHSSKRFSLDSFPLSLLPGSVSLMPLRLQRLLPFPYAQPGELEPQSSELEENSLYRQGG